MAERVDVVVVGAGTAGLGAARALAAQGRRVLVLERRRASEGGGARWCNAVLPAHFARARLPLPSGAEVRAAGGASLMISPSGRHRVRVEDSPLWECDMRLLVARLGRDAESSGAEVSFGVAELRFEFDDARPRAVSFATPSGRRRVHADLFVDASGLRGTLRALTRPLREACPTIAPSDICAAHQVTFRVSDRDGARRFLDAERARPNDALTTLGLAGGYSTRVVRVAPSLDEVSILTGAIPRFAHRTAKQLIAEFVAGAPWVGEPIFGGGGAIPLRRVSHRLTAPGVALVGDAGCQVMAGHGSGVGLGLLAGRALADAVEGSPDPGDPVALFGYQAAYLRRHGAVFAGYDAVRRMSVRLESAGVERLFEAGLLSPALAEAGLHQQLATPAIDEALGHARALARRPDLAPIVGPALAAMAIARPLYAAHPRRGGTSFTAWRAVAERLLPAQTESWARIEDERPAGIAPEHLAEARARGRREGLDDSPP